MVSYSIGAKAKTSYGAELYAKGLETAKNYSKKIVKTARWSVG